MKKTCSLLFSLIAIFGLSVAHAEPQTVGPYTFELPADATTKPGGGMRALEVTFKVAEGEGPTAVFFVFGASGIEANIKRWAGQFEGGAPKEEREKIGEDGMLVILSGTYLDGPPVGGGKVAKEGYRMLGAILPHESGKAVFIKLTAPEKIADEVRGAFTDMVKSAIK